MTRNIDREIIGLDFSCQFPKAQGWENELPLTLLEAVPNGELESTMRAPTEVGLVMRANLITFQMLGLEVISVSNAAATLDALVRHGLLKPNDSLPRTPFKLADKLPELYAKIIRSTLEGSGATVEFVMDELSHVPDKPCTQGN